MSSETERLSKFLSTSGIASRRKCDELISSGRVKVNGIKVLEPYYQVFSNKDKISVDNVTVTHKPSSIYLALYKPINFISDLVADKGRKNARSLISLRSFLFPVGRLDYSSEGLILFTNDGDFAYKITHPKYGVEKEYLVKFKGIIPDNSLLQVQKGINIEGSIYKVKSITFFKTSFLNSWYRIVLNEGKNRMIRKIGNKIKHPVLKLKRIRVGPVRLGNLKPGEYRPLTDKEKVYFLKLSEPKSSKENQKK